MKKFWLALLAVLLLAVGLYMVLRPTRVAEIDSFQACAGAGFPVRQTNPPSCDDGHQTFVGPKGTPLPSQEPLTVLDIQTLVEGDSQGTYPAKSQVIASQAAWQQYWQAVHRSLPTMPNLIPVDFSKNDVLALNMGPEPTGGYSISLLSLSQGAHGYMANVQERRPGGNCRLPNQASGPYFMALVPKLSGPVQFSISQVTRNCGP